MPFDSCDDVLFWHGSLIGYTAGVKAACEDKKKSDLLLEMSEVQSKLEIEELKNSKLRELLCELYEDQCDDGDRWKYRDRMSKFGIEVD